MLEIIEAAIGKMEKLLLFLAPADSAIVVAESTNSLQHEALAVLHVVAAVLTLAAVFGHSSLCAAHHVHARRIRS